MSRNRRLLIVFSFNEAGPKMTELYLVLNLKKFDGQKAPRRIIFNNICICLKINPLS